MDEYEEDYNGLLFTFVCVITGGLVGICMGLFLGWMVWA